MFTGLENPVHLLIILVVLLMVFGAKRLPGLGRDLGSGLRGFKEALTSGPADGQADATVGVGAVCEDAD